VILELLGEELKTEPGELGQRLSAAGADMPIDSLIMVEILVRVETRFGVRVAETAPTARALRSVCGFAELIVDLVEEGEDEDGR
jgi:acyl carrier protein